MPVRYVPGADPNITKIKKQIGSKQNAAKLLEQIIKRGEGVRPRAFSYGGSNIDINSWPVEHQGFLGSRVSPSNPKPKESPVHALKVKTSSIQTHYYVQRTSYEDAALMRWYKIHGVDKKSIQVYFLNVRQILYAELRLGGLGGSLSWHGDCFMEKSSGSGIRRKYFWVGLSRYPLPSTFTEDYAKHRCGQKSEDRRFFSTLNLFSFSTRIEDGYLALAALEILCINLEGGARPILQQ